MRRSLFTLMAALLVVLPSGGAAQEENVLADPGAFSATVTHPFFPLATVRYKEYVGEERDPDTGEVIQTRVVERVLPETATVAGAEVAVVEVMEYEDGELVERTLDYYAQHRDGTVYYLGEKVDDYEDGQVVDHSGEWLAGEGENLPGVFLPLDPQPGQVFEQERAPGIAEDRSTVLALDESVTTPAGTFAGCMRTEDVNPLDGDVENKLYCPGVGIVREESTKGALELVAFAGGGAGDDAEDADDGGADADEPDDGDHDDEEDDSAATAEAEDE